MNILRRPGLLIAVIGTFVIGFLIPAWFKPGPAPPLRIGKDTTHVTSPLLEDGSIDFAGALDRQLSIEVRPQDNAAVLLDQAFGPSSIDRKLRQKYLQAIGVEALPEQGDYVRFRAGLFKQRFEGVEDPDAAIEAWIAQSNQAGRQPWNAESNPAAEEWLQANVKPLELIEQASKRHQYYVPKVEFFQDTTSYNLKPAAELLVARAMRRLGHGDTAGAWDDLRAGHRLASLASHNCLTTIPFNLAISADSLIRTGDVALIETGLSADQARNCIADIDQLPGFVSIADLIDQGERYHMLFTIMSAMEEKSTLDVNVMLKQANQTLDALIEALKSSDWETQKQALFQVIDQVEDRITQLKKSTVSPMSQILMTRHTASLIAADTLLTNGLTLVNLQQVILTHLRGQVHRDLVRLGFALAAHRADHLAYPKSLDELVPAYLPAIPLDRFTGKPLVYVPGDNGFQIYSVGVNQQDDRGVMSGPADDVLFEVPAARETP